MSLDKKILSEIERYRTINQYITEQIADEDPAAAPDLGALAPAPSAGEAAPPPPAPAAPGPPRRTCPGPP